MRFGVISPLVVAIAGLLLSTVLALAQLSTPVWVSFYSLNSSIAGQPLAVGSVIHLYSPNHVLCGVGYVRVVGTYGLINCYLDDPNTQEQEGIQPGDTVRFTINGETAGWTRTPTALQNGDRFLFDIQIAQLPVDLPGDCNSDQTVGAADLTALALEFFDGDDNNDPADTPNGAYPGTPACDANEDGRIGASDLTCIALIFFNGPGACQVGQSAVAHSQPTLVIPDDLVAEAGGQVTVPIVLQGNGAEVSSLLFSIDYDERWLTIDPADHDEDGVSDAIVFNLPEHFVRSVTIDLNDASGELDIMIASFASPAHVLPEGELLSITFGLGNSADTTEATIAFAQQPEPSFGDRDGHAISGSAQDGVVRIVATGESGSASVLHLPMISR